MTSARDVIAHVFYTKGPDKLDGFSPMDRQNALQRTDAILAALDAAGYRVIHIDELNKFKAMLTAAKEPTP